MKFLLVWFFAGVLEVSFTRGDQTRWRTGVGYTYPKPTPQEIMVDAVNYVGLLLLHAHNQNNENNIALSPYGATSVLVTLGEGVQGSALDEILRATLLPLDVSVTRVGLRDIHRHLKSYFIPQEGFLAGLTFSHENVTLKSTYEDILRFYGYDVDSFNNPLYPDPYTSTTTEPTTGSLSITESTMLNNNSTPIPTTIASSTTFEDRGAFTNTTSSTLSTTPTIAVTTTTTTKKTTASPTASTSIQNSTRPSPTTKAQIQTTTNPPSTTFNPTAQTTNSPFTTTQTTIATESPTTTTSEPSTTQPTTLIQTSTTSQPISTSSTTTVTSSQAATAGPAESTITTTNVVSSVPLSTEPISTQRPTSVTLTIVQSTISSGENTLLTTSASTVVTPAIQADGSISINLQPTTITNGNTDDNPIATTIAGTATVEETTPTIASTQDTAITISVTPGTIGTESTEPGSTINPVSDSLSLRGDLPTGFEINVIPSTVSSGSTEPTTARTTTNLATSNPQTSIDIDVVPSTISSSGSTEASTVSTTENLVLDNLPPAGELPTGFEISVTPTTVAPRSEKFSKVQNLERKDVRKATSRSSIPRFRDDAELVGLLKTENKSATLKTIKQRGFMSQGSTNLFSSEKMSVNSTIASSENIQGRTTGFTTISISNNEDTMSTKILSSTNGSPNSKVKTITTFSKESSDEDGSSEETTLTISVLNDTDRKIRTARSVIDYLIARYHDNDAQSQLASSYQPIKPTTFAVNGKLREPNISFMTYDTILPFRYISYLNALALTFPLDSTKYYLLLILPVDEMGIDTLINNMMSTTLKQIIYDLQPTRVKATIPSFMLKGYVVLTPTLQKLGIRQIFEPRHADFSRMTDDKDIYVTNIEQAVTVTIRNYVDPATLQNNNQHIRRRGPVQFLADHPFLYFVMDSQIHVALMAGKIINPLNSRIR